MWSRISMWSRIHGLIDCDCDYYNAVEYKNSTVHADVKRKTESFNQKRMQNNDATSHLNRTEAFTTEEKSQAKLLREQTKNSFL